MIKHNDMLGNSVNVNDIVVCYGTIASGHPNYPKHGIIFGKVAKLTPKMVTIKCIRISGKEKDEIRVSPKQLAVVNEHMLTSLMKKRLATI